MALTLNLKQIVVFRHVAKHLSFTRAAEELFVTQPAVRMQIDALEEQYGTKFLSRDGKKLKLTDAGEALLPYADRIVELGIEAEQLILNLKDNPHGLLRIGTTKTWARYLMPTYVLNFQRKYPELHLRLDEGSSEEMAQSVLHGVNDLAIVGRVQYDSRLEAMPFPGKDADELVLVVYPAHRLAKRKTVCLEDLREDPIILKEKGSGTRHLVEEYFKKNDFTPAVFVEASSAPFIKDLVIKEAAVTILTKLSIEEEERRGTLKGISFGNGGLSLPIDIILPREGYHPAAVRSFLGYLEDLRQGEDAEAALDLDLERRGRA